MDRPLISVLLCVYNPNREQFREAVDSIIGQTFTEWEMLKMNIIQGRSWSFSSFRILYRTL